MRGCTQRTFAQAGGTQAILSPTTDAGGKTLEHMIPGKGQFMQHWRWFVLAALVAVPILVLIGFGVYHLWWTGLGFWLWWPLMGCLALAYFLAWRWQKRRRLLRVDFTAPPHWTDRDR